MGKLGPLRRAKLALEDLRGTTGNLSAWQRLRLRWLSWKVERLTQKQWRQWNKLCPSQFKDAWVLNREKQPARCELAPGHRGWHKNTEMGCTLSWRNEPMP